jgi:hypothetical protein
LWGQFDLFEKSFIELRILIIIIYQDELGALVLVLFAATAAAGLNSDETWPDGWKSGRYGGNEALLVYGQVGVRLRRWGLVMNRRF